MSLAKKIEKLSPKYDLISKHTKDTFINVLAAFENAAENINRFNHKNIPGMKNLGNSLQAAPRDIRKRIDNLAISINDSEETIDLNRQVMSPLNMATQKFEAQIYIQTVPALLVYAQMTTSCLKIKDDFERLENIYEPQIRSMDSKESKAIQNVRDNLEKIDNAMITLAVELEVVDNETRAEYVGMRYLIFENNINEMNKKLSKGIDKKEAGKLKNNIEATEARKDAMMSDFRSIVDKIIPMRHPELQEEGHVKNIKREEMYRDILESAARYVRDELGIKVEIDLVQKSA